MNRKVTIRFCVLFSDCCHVYSVASYLTLGAALRYVKSHYSGWLRRHERSDLLGWAIEREITISGGTGDSWKFRLHEGSCVLCQTKGFPVWHNMKRENMISLALPYSLRRRRFPRWTDLTC